MSSTPTSGAHVFLHIGTMKTGTSFLQQVLERNAETLARDGGVYANGAQGMRGAIQDVLTTEDATSPGGPWSRLTQQSREHTGSRVIVSSELLSFADDARAEQIVASFRPNPVTVIITARDLVRLLPSAWQNKVKHGRAWPFSRYVDSVMGDSGPKGATRSFWHHHDLGAIVRRWVVAAGADNVVVIPVPGRDAGPNALWERFAAVTGLAAAEYDLTQDRRSNLSLGYAETELLRHVNRRLRDQADWSRHKKVIQRMLANEVLRPDPSRPTTGERPVLTPAQHAWAATRSQELADEVAAAGVRVEGSLDELVPAPLSEEEKRAARASVPPEIPAMFIDVVAALVERLVEARADVAETAQVDWTEHDEGAERPDRTDRPGRSGRRNRRTARSERGGAEATVVTVATVATERDHGIDPDLADEFDDLEG